MLLDLLKTIQDLSLSQTIRKSLWVFPTLECIHLYSMVFLVTVIASFDMRLMGLKIVDEAPPLPKFSRLAFLLSSVCFGVNFLTGLLLFSSHSTDYYVNSAFLAKMGLIVVAVAYHLFLFSRASKSVSEPVGLLRRKVAAVTSLLLWMGVLAASRWIAFV
jgi:hypothetical protein